MYKKKSTLHKKIFGQKKALLLFEARLFANFEEHRKLMLCLVSWILIN